MIRTVLFTIVFLRVPSVGLAQDHSNEFVEAGAPLHQWVHNYTVAASNFVYALIEVAGRFKIPMGIQWVREPSDTRAVHLAWKDASVQTILQDIVHVQPGYELRGDKALVHIGPRGFPASQKNFLTLQIPQFEVQHQVAEIASWHLYEFVNSKVTPREAHSTARPGGVIGSQGVEIGDPVISISLRNVTAEDVLDSISRASPFKIWLVTFAGDGETPGGFRRTVSPIDGHTVRDDQQPGWELLQWGRRPY